MSEVFHHSDESICLNLGFSIKGHYEKSWLLFALLTNDLEAFLHNTSPVKAFSSETVNFMIHLLSSFMLGHNFEFWKSR